VQIFVQVTSAGFPAVQVMRTTLAGAIQIGKGERDGYVEEA